MLNKAMHSRSEAWMALMDHSPYGAVAYYTEGCNILGKSHNIEFMHTSIYCTYRCTVSEYQTVGPDFMVCSTYLSFGFVFGLRI